MSTVTLRHYHVTLAYRTKEHERRMQRLHRQLRNFLSRREFKRRLRSFLSKPQTDR